MWRLSPKQKDQWICCVCNCTHTKYKPHLFRIEGATYITCMRRNEHNAKAICLCKDAKSIDTERDIPDVVPDLLQPMMGIPNTIEVHKYRDMRCKPFPPMDTWKTLMVCAEKGSGKTYQLGAFLKTVPEDMPICIIGFRVALCEELMRRLSLHEIGFTFYGHPGWEQASRIVTTIESLSKWKHPLNRCICIIDEYESGLGQLDADTNHCRAKTLAAFGRIVREASHMMVLDAGLTWNVGANILRAYGRDYHGFLVHWNTTRLCTYGAKTYHVHKNKNSWVGAIQHEPPGTKINIRCGSHATQIASSVSKIRGIPREQWVCITGDSAIKGDNVEDTYDAGGTVQLCVVNSVHQAGNSYDKEYFDVLYTIGDGYTAGPLALIQMEGRVRHHAREDVHAFISYRNMPRYMLDPHLYYKYMEGVSAYDVADLTPEEIEWKLVLTPPDKLLLSLVRTRDALCRHYMKEIYRWYQEDVHGYKVVDAVPGVPEMALPKPDTDIKWSIMAGPLIPIVDSNMIREDAVDDMVVEVGNAIIPADEHPDTRRHKLGIIRDAYYYGMCIKHRDYKLSWKHAEKIFHDHWYKKGRQRMVYGCVYGRQQYLEYAARYKKAIADGLSIDDASIASLPSEDDDRDAVTRYNILMKIKNMASISCIDGIHMWRFKAILRNDPVWQDIMRRCGRRFGIHVMDKGTCHHDMWRMLSTLFTKEYGIIHTMVDERVGREKVHWWVIRFSSDDALVDVG